jgi:hypothetical protein
MTFMECPKCREEGDETAEARPCRGHGLEGANQPNADGPRPRRRPSAAFYVLLAAVALGILAVILFQAVLFWK